MTYHIRSVTNGYVLTNGYGDEYIAKSLLDAATVTGEYIPNSSSMAYATGKSKDTLREVVRLASAGEKISAIKLLRDCYSSTLGLREAKELVELFIEIDCL